MSIYEIFIALWNRCKTSKYPDENPDQPNDFKNHDPKPKKSKAFVNCLWLPKINLGKKTKGYT